MTDTPAVTVNEERSRFETTVEGHTAFLDFRLDGTTITLIHTEVPEELEGKGVGSAIVRAALDYVRANDLTMIPECEFVQSYIERHPEAVADLKMG